MYPYKTYVIGDGVRALLLRDGRIECILDAGRHRVLDPHGRTQMVHFTLHAARLIGDWARIIQVDHPELVEAHFIAVRPTVGMLALITRNGKPLEILRQGDNALYWKAAGELEITWVDLSQGLEVDAHTAELWRNHQGQALMVTQIEPYQVGLLVVDGAPAGRLAPGRHTHWTVGRAVGVKVYDLRDQILEVTAQEILTKDRVSIRVTLTAVYAITDVDAVYARTADLQAVLYRAAQVAIREAVGGRTLDVLLRERHTVDIAIDEAVRAAMADAGVAVKEVRVKDVILPGEMRDILNRVVEAEKAAEANVIRRREETAATRALLNTAKLMDDNPTLMRLKELETVERLTEKVGHIELRQHAGGAGLTSLVDTLMGRENDA